MKTRPNILMLTPSYDPIIGGTETVVKDLTDKLNSFGARTDVMTFNMEQKWHPIWKSETHKEASHLVHRVPAVNPFNILGLASRFLPLNVLPSVLTARKTSNYDVLHFHDVIDLTFPLLCSFVNRPKVLHCHSLNETFPMYVKNELYRRFLTNAADVYLATSTSACNLLSRLGVAPEEITILHYGVDTDIFVPKENNRQDDLVLFVGRWERRKGISVLLRSLDYLERPVHLVMIGPSYNDEYSRGLLELVRSKSRKHKISYLGAVGRNELIEWFQRASLSVCPSTVESFGIVCVEAIACECPVIASDIDGVRDIVTNNENGILVPPNNAKELAIAIQYLLDNPEIGERLGRRGRTIVQQKFSLNVAARKLLSIYRDVVK
ncbi:glycosyltransferase family 4 protein [Candidatus Bathyarchaeota archaeon]|nr:glycosyltransferase family 4 protein [Candidatus Bathyarchaeota archaeon]